YLFSTKPPATTEIYTLSLHDALPIFADPAFIQDCGTGAHIARKAIAGCFYRQVFFLADGVELRVADGDKCIALRRRKAAGELFRSEEHTSELQSQSNLVCRLLLEKKK